MVKDGVEAKVIYLGTGDKKKSASGRIETKETHIRVDLAPSKRRTKFNTVLIPWHRVLKVIQY